MDTYLCSKPWQIAVLAFFALALGGCSASSSGGDDAGLGGNQAVGGAGGGSSAGSAAGGNTNPVGGSGGVNSSGGAATTGGSSALGGSGGSAVSGSGGTMSGSGGGYGGTGLGGTGAAGITGDPGVWENVTPDGIDLSSSFGVQDVLADPANPGIFYGFVCKQGVYKSTDWGGTWTHIGDGSIEHGSPWGEAMAPDGSYMLASVGYPDNGNQGAWKSTDGGATWAAHSISNDNDPYNFNIDPLDKDHVLTAMHASDHIYESTDGGETWSDRGSAGAGGSNYVFFLTSTTWLVIGQDTTGLGTRRTTNSGTSWTNVAPMEHAHGNAQIFIDPDNGFIYGAGHNNGVYRSTDGGASFTQVSNTRGSSVFATATQIYSMDPGANGGGTAPTPQSATRDDGTDWAAFTVPDTMTNGAKRAAVMYNAETSHWVIAGGYWNAGFWRYIEP